MTAPVSLTEAKLFLRVEHEAEDQLIETLIAAARARVEGEVGLSLTSTSPAPPRLSSLTNVCWRFASFSPGISVKAACPRWNSC